MSIFDSKEPVPAKDLTAEDCKEMIIKAINERDNGDSKSFDLLAEMLLVVFQTTNVPFLYMTNLSYI